MGGSRIDPWEEKSESSTREMSDTEPAFNVYLIFVGVLTGFALGALAMLWKC